jgi:hypothetical protein
MLNTARNAAKAFYVFSRQAAKQVFSKRLLNFSSWRLCDKEIYKAVATLRSY